MAGRVIATPVTTTFAYDATGQCAQTVSYGSSSGRTVTHYPFAHDELARPQSWQLDDRHPHHRRPGKGISAFAFSPLQPIVTVRGRERDY